jgi:signal transduction histidine kinase
MCINVVKGTTDPALPFYADGGSFYINGMTRFLATVSEADKGQTRNVCNQTGYESVAVIPIRMGTRILGLIHLADRNENMVPLLMVRILEQVAAALGVGVQRALAETELRQNTGRLEEINRDLESFSYPVSHDLGAPLRAITGYSQMILKRQGEQFNEETLQRFQVIVSNAETMGRLIDDLLAFSRLGCQSVTKESLDMEQLIKDGWQELPAIIPTGS